MGGEPVQIIRVKDDHSIELNEPELKRILLADHVKDRPVVVISIAGEYRQGKSFLLSFFLRYLQNNCRSNWMDDEETPLIGFQWRPGSIRETTGILIWTEAFLMTNSKGEEVAVLLMDTQGIFDCESTMKESTMIFSLSMMASSVQIYNVMSNIKEDDLQHLQFFAEYGMLAHKENERHPFQKLLFLVRDWNWPYEWEFGSRGGRALIASRLQINDGQDTELKTLRQSIKSSFSDIDCFLMPHPGDKVAREKSFDGRLVDINEEFREKLQELVPSILAPDNLLVKEINGRTLSCQELMILFKAYAGVFSGSDLPKPTSLMLATANACNLNAMDKARKHYVAGMRSRPRRNLEELRQFHSALLEEALKVFKDYPRMGSESTSTTSMDALTKELEQYFEQLLKEEEELMKKEQEEEAKREKERCEEKKREAERERERVSKRLRVAAREAEIAEERAAMRRRVAQLEAREHSRDGNVFTAVFKWIGSAIGALFAGCISQFSRKTDT